MLGEDYRRLRRLGLGVRIRKSILIRSLLGGRIDGVWGRSGCGLFGGGG